MKNPLNKRFLRELKSDFGRYIAIFLFLIIFSGGMSAFFITDNSIQKIYYKGASQNNLEDGHLAFNKIPEKSILNKLEKDNKIKFYNLYYKEESVKNIDATLRIYKDRTEINKECVMSGTMPKAKNEIAIDRLWATNHNLKVGSTVTIQNKKYKITALVSLCDYICLFQNNSDMMYNSIKFGVAVMSDKGYKTLGNAHETYNYGWKYNTKVKDDEDENNRSEDFTDSLKAVLKKYDQNLVQQQVDSLYAKAETLSDTLKDQFTTASDTIKTKVKDAYKKATAKVMANPTLQTKMDSLVAKELGTTKAKYKAMTKAFKKADKLTDTVGSTASKNHKIDFDKIEDEKDYENDMDFSLDDIYDIVDKIKATGICNTSEIYTTLDKINNLTKAKIDDSDFLEVKDYLSKLDNKAINFAIEDSKSDLATGKLITYIIMIVIAFLFAVTISNTITRESAVIGTLRASGYSRGELIRHYMVLPIIVTVLGCGVGNILSYTGFSRVFVSIYYSNYSLPIYENYLNLDAFVTTTVVPFIFMLIINFAVLTHKLKISPLNFLRGELKKKKNKHTLRLSTKIPFFARFRIRILLQNIPAYLTMFVGILLAGTLLVFGTMFVPLLNEFGGIVKESSIAKYQYVLKDQVETKNKQAEKYCLTSLDTTYENYLTDEVSIYGISKNSKYIKKQIPKNQVLISNGMADKYSLQKGDKIKLKDPYSPDYYEFTVAGQYKYDAAISVFMNKSQYLKTFDEDSDYFTGYFSNQKLKDIDDKDIATIVQDKDLTKLADQLVNSMGGFMTIFKFFGIIIFLLLMYVLTKQIIEKNVKSISMSKILGFTDIEIGRLYLIITSIVVLVSLLLAIPIIDVMLRLMFKYYMYTEISGYFPYICFPSSYVQLVLFGMACYLVVAIGMIIKIKRLPKDEALKNQAL